MANQFEAFGAEDFSVGADNGHVLLVFRLPSDPRLAPGAAPAIALTPEETDRLVAALLRVKEHAVRQQGQAARPN